MGLDMERVIKMRASGKSFQEIANEFDVTRQYVHQELSRFLDVDARYGNAIDKMIYPNLAKYMRENNFSLKDLSELADLCHATLGPKTRGERHFSKSDIDSLIKTTGIPYEALFMQKEG